jgi:hypothetical protein
MRCVGEGTTWRACSLFLLPLAAHLVKTFFLGGGGSSQPMDPSLVSIYRLFFPSSPQG